MSGYRFIVLQHDLFEITVDLAVGYTLNAALTHNPAFDVSLPKLSRSPSLFTRFYLSV